MAKKITKNDEAFIILEALSVVSAIQRLMRLWHLPEDLDKFFGFLTRNTAFLVDERMRIENLPEETETQVSIKQSELRRNTFSKIQHTGIWSIEAMSQAAINLVWRALIVGRYVNRMRLQMGLKPIEYYQEAIQLDREMAGDDGPIGAEAVQEDHQDR